jgi:hypothetical protein
MLNSNRWTAPINKPRLPITFRIVPTTNINQLMDEWMDKRMNEWIFFLKNKNQ